MTNHPAPPAPMSDEITPSEALSELEVTARMLERLAPEIFPEINEHGQKHFGRAIMESAAETIRAALPEIDRLRNQPQPQPASGAGVVAVPVEVVAWLLGEGGDFECPPEQYFLGKPAPFWWRKRLRESLATREAGR